MTSGLEILQPRPFNFFGILKAWGLIIGIISFTADSILPAQVLPPPSRSSVSLELEGEGDLLGVRHVAFWQENEDSESEKQVPGIRTASNSNEIKLLQIHPFTGMLTPSLTTPNADAKVLTIPTLIDPIQEPDVVPLTLETLNSRRAAAEERTDLDAEGKAQLAKHYNRALELLNQAIEADGRQKTWKSERDNSPNLITELKAQLDQPTTTSIDFNPTLSSSELEQLRIEEEEKLTEAQGNLARWESRSIQRAERRPQMAGIIEATRKQLEEAELALKAASPEGESATLGIARRSEKEALLVLLKVQLELYRTEQQRYEALGELFPLQRDLLTRNCNTLAKRVELWQAAITQARLVESEQQRRQAREKLQNAHPALRDLAQRNSLLTQQRKDQQQAGQRAKATLVEIQETYQRIDQQFRDMADKEKRVGFTTAFGLLLRNHRLNLPEAKPYKNLKRTSEQEMVKLQTEQMQFEDERKDLVDIEKRLESLIKDLTSEALSDEDLPKMARELLTDQRKYMDDLLADYNQHLSTQSEINTAAEKLAERIREYDSFLDERVLWIASAPMVSPSLPFEGFQAAKSIGTRPDWTKVIDYGYGDIGHQLPLYTAVILGIILLVFLRVPAKRVVGQLHSFTQNDLYSGVPQTILATLASVFITSAWPALVLFIGWRLAQSESPLAVALGDSFRFGAIHFLALNAMRGICEREGVAQRFLNWPKRVVSQLHRTLMVYILIGIPLLMLVSFTSNLDDSDAVSTFGRIGLVCFCILLALIIHRIARPNGMLAAFLRSDESGGFGFINWILYLVSVLSPLGLAVLALMGYQYTAEQLLIRFELTLGLAFLLFVGSSMFTRWMMAARRKLASQQAQSRRDATSLATASPSPPEAMIPLENPPVDLSLLNRQALKVWQVATMIVFLCGCWAIWSQVLPALQVFSRVALWSYAIETTELVERFHNEPTMQEFTRVETVTLGHALLAFGVLVVMILAAKNLPGVLEFSFLQRIHFDQGARTAISKLTGYALVVAGVIIATKIIGLRWNNVQWLVAALTVGLGFGLQEIFANFVSGLIILFERPVRVGDVVTIDNVTGTVSRIQIRATTITDFDCKEFIVPNKEFVTGRLMNWTLTDRRHRLIVEVGVSYDSDIEKSLRILQQIPRENSHVLVDPAPIVTFESFGDSTLKLILRVFLANVDHRFFVRTELNLEIAKRFKAAGIVFSYPQRDLHIRSFSAEAASALFPTVERQGTTEAMQSRPNTNQAA